MSSRQSCRRATTKSIQITQVVSSCRITPGDEGATARSPVLTGGEAMAAELKVVVDPSVTGKKLLGMPD
jgi:hypothetical protein